MKTCSRCAEDKPLSEFYRREASRDGLDPTCKPCRLASNAAYYAEKRETILLRQRTYILRRNFKLTEADLELMKEAQGGRCAACVASLADGLHIDHDHACCPGRRSCGQCVRGLLCPSCNRALGFLRDDPVRLRALADYLEGK